MAEESKSVVSEHSLSAAVEELHAQHPHKQDGKSDQRGPFHSGSEHCRHKPVIGKKRGD